MAMQLEPHRQALIEQVLEYWYTVDFLAQGGLNTEQTRRDRESLSFAMGSPHRFTALYRHENLKPDGDILENVSLLENTIRSKREMLAEQSGQNYGALKPPCHGKITVFLGLIDQSFLSIAIANELNCELPQNPSSSKLALASLQLTDEGRYIRDTFSLSPVIWSLGRILSRESGNTMYETLDPDVYENAEKEFAPEADSILYFWRE